MRRDAVPMPPLNSWQIIPVPPPTLPSGTGPDAASAECRQRVVGGHVEAVDVVQMTVVGLADHRQRPRRHSRGTTLDLGPDERVVDDPDAVRVGQADRPAEESRLADPLEAGQLAVAVEPMAPGEDRLGPDLAVVRDDDGDAGPDRTLPTDQRTVAADDRPMADPDPGHVGDRVARAWLAEADDDAEVASSHPCSVPAGATPRRGRAAGPLGGRVARARLSSPGDRDASPRSDRSDRQVGPVRARTGPPRAPPGARWHRPDGRRRTVPRPARPRPPGERATRSDGPLVVPERGPRGRGRGTDTGGRPIRGGPPSRPPPGSWPADRDDRRGVDPIRRRVATAVPRRAHGLPRLRPRPRARAPAGRRRRRPGPAGHAPGPARLDPGLGSAHRVRLARGSRARRRRGAARSPAGRGAGPTRRRSAARGSHRDVAAQRRVRVPDEPGPRCLWRGRRSDPGGHRPGRHLPGEPDPPPGDRRSGPTPGRSIAPSAPATRRCSPRTSTSGLRPRVRTGRVGRGRAGRSSRRRPSRSCRSIGRGASRPIRSRARDRAAAHRRRTGPSPASSLAAPRIGPRT